MSVQTYRTTSWCRAAGLLAALAAAPSLLLGQAPQTPQTPQTPQAPQTREDTARTPTAARPTPNVDNESDGADRRPTNRKSVTRELPGGAKVTVAFGLPKTGGREYAEMESLAQGKVVRFFDAAATKLSTGQDLEFGDTTVRQGNVAPDYPGVYSLWLQRDAGGWRLVFNEKADVWGTQHDASADVASVPLQHTRVDGISLAFEAKIESSAANDGSWLLELSWGEHRWSAPFRPAAQ